MHEKGSNWHDQIMHYIKSAGLIKKGDNLILTEGMIASKIGGTDSLRIISVE
jgi:pyruvate kinase